MNSILSGVREAEGLYHPDYEHDSCGIGFVAHIKGHKSHDIIKRGLNVLLNMAHRGAESSDNKSGDGAGITIQIPHKFLLNQGLALPGPGEYGTGLIFLPQNQSENRQCRNLFQRITEDEGLTFLAQREVPVNAACLGEISLSSEPKTWQVFLGAPLEQDELERKLYIVRKRVEKEIRISGLLNKETFYILSLSTKIIIYKGMFTPEQLPAYFTDLNDPLMESAIALVHSRFSTNTFPSWDLAQPFRYLAHNGEINTIKGNRLWMHTRESLLTSELFGADLEKLFPIVEPGKSDSASLDNVLEFLTMTGRSIPNALSILIPESWNNKNPIPESLKAFYEFHSTYMEPWDGPASILFTDGRYVGGTLDRNGLRPSRYLITKDDLIVMGSETGVQSFKGEEIIEKGRLRPGKLLLVDTQLGTIIPDKEIKANLARRNPYANWLKENRLELEDIKVQKRFQSRLGNKHQSYLKSFGYSKEDVYDIIRPMAIEGKEPIGSMGNDTPMAVLSKKPQRLFNYFRQMFAQVTNPAIDPIRERLVMSLTNYIGSVQKNLLTETAEHCKLVKFKSPIITNTDLGKIKDLKHESFTHAILNMTFPRNSETTGLKNALEKLCKDAEKAVDEGKNFIILSDRKISKTRVPIPSLLAVSAVHHHLIKVKKRMQTGLIVETGEAREVHHFALLIAYGASIVNPYVSFAVIANLVDSGKIDAPYSQARKNYLHAINTGLLKIISKMGISTLRSYFGSQLFEAIGLGKEVIDSYFNGTPSRIGGIGLNEISEDALTDHTSAFYENYMSQSTVNHQGIYSYRKNGEFHAWEPEMIGYLQWATANNDYNKFKEFSRLSDQNTARPNFIRGMLDFKKAPIDISEVEPETEIMKRFVTGAMSFGSISKEAHEALAIAMNEIGGRSNTGEGGEDPKRFGKYPDGKNRRSAIKQIASGRFGVNIQYLVNADEIQIKVAQGAKPGEGGQLPGYKVDKIIGRIRNATPGIMLISPPPHHDIYSIEDLAQLIFDLKNINDKTRVSVKLVSENGVGTVAAGVAKAYADLIVISGTDGGTGASPVSSIKHAGIPWEMGLAETHQTLVRNNLRNRVKLQTDGQIKTGRDIILAGLLGAEEIGIATASLIVLGCVMMRKCHLNTCPAGIATQNKKLRKRFSGKAAYVVNYFTFLAREVREYMALLGIRKFDDLVGRTDLLHVRKDLPDSRLKTLDLSALIDFQYKGKTSLINSEIQPEIHYSALNTRLTELSGKAIQNREKVWISEQIHNTDRSTGIRLSADIAGKYGKEGLPEDTINCNFYGSAGQSFGAFLARGITFKLEGDANDYLGKGLSGGKIIVVPPALSTLQAEKNIIIGNTILYGGTEGSLYVNGVAGERFCVRNSGANAVVEGVGDHGCEYMTGGRVVVLGITGRNFAAGMSGGIAYVLNLNKDFEYYCNQSLVELSGITDYDDVKELQGLISNHLVYTKSPVAERILSQWDTYLPEFVKVLPLEYKKVLAEQKIREVNIKLQRLAQNIETVE